MSSFFRLLPALCVFGAISCDQPTAVQTDTNATVNVLESPGEMLQGETLRLEAVVRSGLDIAMPSATISWSSSAPNVATVSQYGLVTAISPGNVTIGARYADHVRVRTLTVLPNTPVSIRVTTQAASVDIGASLVLSADVRGAHDLRITNPRLKWSSDHPDIAAVTSTGLVQGLSIGTATVRVSCGDLAQSYALLVRSITPMSIEVTGPSDSLLIGSTAQLHANVMATDGLPLTQPVQWTVAGSVVTVSPAGVVKGAAGGTATVVAKIGTLTAQRTVSVYPFARYLTSVGYGWLEDLGVGESEYVQTGGSAEPGVGPVEPVILTSSDPAIATVSALNVVIALSAGTVTITATARHAAPVSKVLKVYPHTVAAAVPGFQTVTVDKGSAGTGWTWYAPTIVMKETSGLAGYRVTAVRVSLVGANVQGTTSMFTRVNAGASRTMWDNLSYYDDPFVVVAANSDRPTGMLIQVDYVDDAGNSGTATTTVNLSS